MAHCVWSKRWGGRPAEEHQRQLRGHLHGLLHRRPSGTEAVNTKRVTSHQQKTGNGLVCKSFISTTDNNHLLQTLPTTRRNQPQSKQSKGNAGLVCLATSPPHHPPRGGPTGWSHDAPNRKLRRSRTKGRVTAKNARSPQTLRELSCRNLTIARNAATPIRQRRAGRATQTGRGHRAQSRRRGRTSSRVTWAHPGTLDAWHCGAVVTP